MSFAKMAQTMPQADKKEEQISSQEKDVQTKQQKETRKFFPAVKRFPKKSKNSRE